ncbi:signal transduction protein [Amphritea japonica ATCC BAA-1530]|uniref:diguanylate cyclase n=2 Tax=Amphritea TaxID=515417 RepID=A0A7R6SS70_9GAMM|nr:signal transduction protein [Amphritea japonica ATCC BAA-1530]
MLAYGKVVHSSTNALMLITAAVIGLLITIVAYQYTIGTEQEHQQLVVAQAATEQRAQLQSSVNSTVEILDSIAKLVAHSDKISSQTFKSFTQPIFKRHAELFALHWIPRVSHNNRDQFERLLNAQGITKGISSLNTQLNSLVSASDREVYYPILYSEPYALNHSVIGLDAYSRRLNAEVIDQLLNGSAEFLSTAPFQLVQDEMDSMSVVFFRSVYDLSSSQEKPVLKGFIAALVKPQILLDKQIKADIGLAIKLEDVTSGSGVQIGVTNHQQSKLAGGSYMTEFMVLGRNWSLQIIGGEEATSGHSSASLILVFGFLFTLMLVVVLSRLMIAHRQVQLERDRAQSYLDTVDTIMLVLDREGCIKMINRKGCEVLGYNPIELMSKQWFSDSFMVDSREEQKRFDVLMSSALVDDNLFLSESKVCTRNGLMRLISWRNNRRFNGKGEVAGVLCSGSDITEQRHAELQDKLRSRAMEATLRGESLSYVLDLVLTGIERQYPGALCSILLLDKTGKHLLNCAGPSIPEGYKTAIHGVEIGDGVGSCGTAAFRRKRVVVEDIATHPYWSLFKDLALSHNLRSCWSEPIFGKKDQLKGTFAIYHEKPSLPSDEDLELITSMAAFISLLIEEFQMEETLLEMANTDGLTGLNNRRKLLESLKGEFVRAKRYDRSFSLCMLDLDYFKKINDQYGHDAGDQVLKAVSDCLVEELRESDIAGRIGGEEFALLLPDTTLSQAAEFSERLRGKVERLSVELRTGEQVTLTTSIGVAEYASAMTLSTDILRLADQRLYEAKGNGRNQVSMGA